MTREEALSMIIDALDNVEDFDEPLNVLRTETDDAAAATWKQKYEDLSAKYKKRFKDEVMNQALNAFEKPEEEEIVPETKTTLEELEFSGETE